MGRILRDINNGLMNRMINHLTDTNLRAFNSTLDKKKVKKIYISKRLYYTFFR